MYMLEIPPYNYKTGLICTEYCILWYRPVKSSIGPTVSDAGMSSILSSNFLNMATLALYSDNIGSVSMNS